MAEKDGLRYVWVDTCCIDKSNNTELSEAINSMFAWYAGAVVCYALLSDVSASPALSGLNSTGQDALEQLSKSRWFTRGWTLQELLAPPKMIFYASDWTTLGARDSLLQVLAKITGVDAAVLSQEKELSACSVAQKLSWASRRSTTRTEDLAYSLLGILNVKMSLLYGEDQDAFRRLQEMTLKNNGDLSILAWSHVEPSRRSNLFAYSPADFFGCGRVILDSSAQATSEHWMTNRGLRGTMSVVGGYEEDQTRSSVFVLLGCHDEGHSSKHTALRLTCSGTSLADQDNVLTVEPYEERITQASLLSRLKHLSPFEVENARVQRTTILYNAQPMSATQAPGKDQGSVTMTGFTLAEEKPSEVRWIGMRRRRALTLVAVLVGLGIVAAAVGGYFASRSHSDHNVP